MCIRSFDQAVFRDNTVNLLAHGPIAALPGRYIKNVLLP